ncbi:hypothetical protein F1544_16575 [Kineosporiaceae bacterium B12]|nr:hypothetical protein [Kineococcus rubinsiae]
MAAQTAAVEAATYKQKALDSSADLDGDDAAQGGRPAELGTRLAASYLGRLAALVGVGLIAVGVVRFPPGPLGPGILVGAGIVLVLAAACVTEVLLAPGPRPSIVRVLVAAFGLSLGAAMLTGGIAHYGELPTRCAFLVPVGLLLSFLAHLFRRGTLLEGVVSWVGGAVAVLTLASFLTLFGLALHETRAAEAAESGTTTGETATTGEHATTEESTTGGTASDEHGTTAETGEHAATAETATTETATTETATAETVATTEHAAEEHATASEH